MRTLVLNEVRKDRELKWDLRFMDLAYTVAKWSKDPSTKVGAVIVRPDLSVASVGFNGFPRGMEDNPYWLMERCEKYSRVVHAEVNALIFAREPVPGYTLYTVPFLPCDRCVVQMLQAGISRFVAPAASPEILSRWGEALERTKLYITQSGATYSELGTER